MDKVRVKRLCESVLNISYSGTTISNFDMTPTFKYDESLGEWIPDSFALFIGIKLPITGEFHKPTEVQKTLEGLLGFDCCVDFA